MDEYLSKESSNAKVEVEDEEENVQKIVEGRDINVVIRARPLLDYEVQQGYFETCFATNKKFHFIETKINFRG